MLTVICGLIGSGKTTYARDNFENVLDLDEIGTKDEQIARAREAVDRGEEAAYITCCPTRAEKAFFDSLDEIHYVLVDTEPRQCLRNVIGRGRKRDLDDIGAIKAKNESYMAKLCASKIPFEHIEVFESNEKW